MAHGKEVFKFVSLNVKFPKHDYLFIFEGNSKGKNLKWFKIWYHRNVFFEKKIFLEKKNLKIDKRNFHLIKDAILI